MTTAEILILIAGILPYAVVAYAKQRSKSTFNNAVPRSAASYSGAAERANGAHLNAFETFPLFAIAVILSELHGMPQSLVNLLALLFVLLRLAYTVLYVQDKPTARSAVWSVSFFVIVIIFLLPVILGLIHVPVSMFSA